MIAPFSLEIYEQNLNYGTHLLYLTYKVEQDLINQSVDKSVNHLLQ